MILSDLQLIDEAQNGVNRLRNVTFISPYERYKRTVKFVITQSEKEDSAKEKKTINEEQEENIDNREDNTIYFSVTSNKEVN